MRAKLPQMLDGGGEPLAIGPPFFLLRCRYLEALELELSEHLQVDFDRAAGGAEAGEREVSVPLRFVREGAAVQVFSVCSHGDA